MIINNNIIELEDKDYKNKFKRLKKYKDKNYIIKNIGNTNEEKAFIKAFNTKNLSKRYNFIYDYMCKFLDKKVCSLCDFKCDKCLANRMKKSVHSINGCCHFRHEGFCKLFDKENKICTNPNISCKLFMCSLIEKKIGFESIPKNYLLLNYFFNRKQKELLRYKLRIPKNEMIDNLLKNV